VFGFVGHVSSIMELGKKYNSGAPSHLKARAGIAVLGNGTISTFPAPDRAIR
jgi:hypothetical protein